MSAPISGPIPALVLALREQAQSCAALGSPFMARLMLGLAELWPDLSLQIVAKMALFSGDLGPRGHSLPLRLAGGLLALVLEGRAPRLAATYPPHEGADLLAAVAGAMTEHDAFLCDWIDRPPQTNETGRSAVLIAAAAEVVARTSLPLHLSELGASAGLNLMFDRYALRIGETTWGDGNSPLTLCPLWSGALPPLGKIEVQARSGVDLTPLNPVSEGTRMLAYVWPDQIARMDRMRTALGMVTAKVDQGDAASWLEARLAQPWGGVCHLVFHTIAHQYFPAESQARIKAAMEAAGARATASAPLAWVGMEADAGAKGAGVTLRLWPGDVHLSLGRAGFHGQWVAWAPQIMG
jgi:hypothetical protein